MMCQHLMIITPGGYLMKCWVCLRITQKHSHKLLIFTTNSVILLMMMFPEDELYSTVTCNMWTTQNMEFQVVEYSKLTYI